MQILEELWYGQLRPSEMVNYRERDYREVAELLSRNEKSLLQTLNDPQKEIYEKIEGQWEELEGISQCASFIAGFRLAVQLMNAAV